MIRSLPVAVAMLLGLCLPVVPTHAAAPPVPGVRHQSTATQVRAHLAALTLGFEPNRGQTAAPVRFLAHGAAYTAFLTDTGITLSLASGQAGTAGVVRLTPAGARSAVPAATDRLSGTVSYFLGSNSRRWLTGIPRFGRVTYHDVYSGIDLAVYGRQTRLEYDWVVHPGADPGAIRLALGGTVQPHAGPHGTLVLSTAAGTLRQSSPNAYQVIAGHRQAVRAKTILRHGTEVFQIGRYNHGLPLVIDPILTYSTYLGGSGNDSANGIAVDPAGDAYVTGYTASTNFPTTSNGYKLTNQGFTDAFLTVINPGGSALLYSSYLGGTNRDFGEGVALDGTADGYVYLTGYTYSGNFPTTFAAVQKSAPAGEQYHGFVTVLNITRSAPSQLVYSTYLGGTASGTTGTAAYGIAADSGHNAYVTGLTYASTLPTLHPFQGTQTANGVLSNAFLIRLSVTQEGPFSLIYGTYFGAASTVGVGAYGVTTDGTGMAAITGFVQGSGLPTRNAYQAGYGGGTDDAFVADFDTNAVGGDNSLVFSTYLGGSGDDIGRGIETDGAGDYYLTGSSSSSDFPQTDTANPVVPSANRGGASDVYATKMRFAAGAPVTILYSILIGGSLEDAGTGIGFDVNGNAYITGYTSSTNFPSVNPLPGQTVYQGGTHDAFVTEVNAQGSGLVYSTYLGGGGDDRGLAIAVLGSDALVAGITTSSNFPSGGALSPTANRGTICPGQTTPCSDGFVARLSPGSPSTGAGTVKGSAICTLHNHTFGTPSCSVSPAVNCGMLATCQLAMQVNAACSTPPSTYSCGSSGGRLGIQVFYARWLSGGTGGTSVDGGTASLMGVGFYGPHGTIPNASFQFDGQDSDTGVHTADSDTFTLTISPINGATFPVTSAHWTCAPPSPPCSLEITNL